MNQQYPSMLLEKAVGEFAKLPGVGRKTAMRLVLHLLRQLWFQSGAGRFHDLCGGEYP